MPTSDPGQLPPYYRPCNVASVRAALTATALEAAPWLWTSLFFRHTQISDISVWFLHDIEIHHDFTVGLTGHFFWLVVYLPLCKNMSSSVGIILPNTWKNKHVPNHQPDIIYRWFHHDYIHMGKIPLYRLILCAQSPSPASCVMSPCSHTQISLSNCWWVINPSLYILNIS